MGGPRPGRVRLSFQSTVASRPPTARPPGGWVLTTTAILEHVERRATDRPPFLAKYGKFLLVGLTGVVVNLAVFTLTLDALSPGPTFNPVGSLLQFASNRSGNPLDDFIASAAAFAVATLWNFTLNNLWTFRTTAGHRHALHYRLGLYYGVSLGSLAINEAVLFVMGLFLPPLFGQGVGIVAGSVVGFTGNYRVTFEEAVLEPASHETHRVGDAP